MQANQQVAGYRLLRRLGQGAVGAVYLAQAPGGAGVVALKLVLLPGGIDGESVRTAFQRSADTARRLDHPGIAALYAAGIEGDVGWLAMEPVPGSDLARYTETKRLLPEPVVLRVCSRIALALAHAHRQGVVHRDIKPANVLVDWASDVVKLVDFGLARVEDDTRTGTGIVPGSPAFMAPEQLVGNRPTPSSDLYALGVMLFQLLTGRLPYEDSSMGELLRRVAEEKTPDPRTVRPSLTPELAELVTRLLAKKPADRPRDGEEAARLLSAVANAGSVTT